MMILKNPKNGAPVSDLWLFNKYYLDSKKGEVFKPGDTLQFEDNIGVYLKKLYAFLEEMSLDEAKQMVEDRKKPFACEHCEFRADTKIAVIGHSRKHNLVKKEEVVVPDIPVIKSETQINQNVVLRNPAQAIEDEAARSGLIGEGLVEERV